MPGTQSWSRVPPSCFRVTNHHGTDVRTESGAYLSSDMPVAGFALIEARDADGAVRLVATTPCAITDRVVEVRPVVLHPPA